MVHRARSIQERVLSAKDAGSETIMTGKLLRSYVSQGHRGGPASATGAEYSTSLPNEGDTGVPKAVDDVARVAAELSSLEPREAVGAATEAFVRRYLRLMP